jgi:hypothetical protein
MMDAGLYLYSFLHRRNVIMAPDSFGIVPAEHFDFVLRQGSRLLATNPFTCIDRA